MRAGFLVVAAFLLGLPAAAQTLPEALALAYTNNPTLQAARARLRATDENVPAALAGWRPTVTLTATYGAADARSRATGSAARRAGTNPTDLDRTLTTGQAVVTQPIYRGGRTVAGTRRAENQVFAERARLLATEQQVLLDTVTAYVNVIRDQQVVRLNANNVQVLARQLQATNDRFRVGEITRTDVAQAEARLAGARAEQANAQGTLQTSIATFTRLVGQPPNNLREPQPIALPIRTQVQANEMAAANNPNVVAARFDEAAARDNIDLQIGALLPTLSVQGSAFRNDNNAQPNNRSIGSQVIASLSVPVYQGGVEYATVRAARQEAQRSRQVVEDARRQATEQATRNWETLQSVRAQVEATRAQIRAAEIALDGVRREAVVGSRTTLDVLNAEQELLNARVALVRALANLVTASYAVTSSIGRLTARDLALPVQLYDERAYYTAVRGLWVGLGTPEPSSEGAR